MSTIDFDRNFSLIINGSLRFRHTCSVDRWRLQTRTAKHCSDCSTSIVGAIEVGPYRYLIGRFSHVRRTAQHGTSIFHRAQNSICSRIPNTTCRCVVENPQQSFVWAWQMLETVCVRVRRHGAHIPATQCRQTPAKRQSGKGKVSRLCFFFLSTLPCFADVI